MDHQVLIVSVAALSTAIVAEKWVAPRLRGRFIDTGHPMDDADDRAVASLVGGAVGLLLGGLLAWVICRFL